MDVSKLFIYFFLLQFLFSNPSVIHADPNCSPKLFREYIGAEGQNITFSDVPINANVEFHFILSFAIDYTNSWTPLPTNGYFNVYWDKENLSPSHVSSIKSEHPNVKVAMSLAGDTVGGFNVSFNPTSIESWVRNAIYSVTNIVKEYNLDGVDIDYEHFKADPDTFAECIGRLLCYLKQKQIVSFTSIAPYEDKDVQPHYLALWRKYGHLIDYVNFQFYADNSGGLKPQNGFFNASSILKSEGKLEGIFIWYENWHHHQIRLQKINP